MGVARRELAKRLIAAEPGLARSPADEVESRLWLRIRSSSFSPWPQARRSACAVRGKLSAVSVQGSPRLRQSLAALDSGYGLNEKTPMG